MKIENKGKDFNVTFNYTEYTVPEGFSDVEDENLATHIVAKGKGWGLEVAKIGVTTKTAIKRVKGPVKIAEDKTEEKKEVKKETKVKKEDKTKELEKGL